VIGHVLLAVGLASLWPLALGAQPAPAAAQPRPHLRLADVPVAALDVDDGDTVTIRWSATDIEIVRILGIDTPETRHFEHDLPYDQSFGPEARAFARGVFATATRVQVMRAATLDPFGRTLGYVLVDGRNYSALVVAARLAVESVSTFGDNGLPQEAAAVVAAARAAGPVPFEPPHVFRSRMREVSRWLKQLGRYPPPW
jgi:micrococcal nuclease